MTIPNPGIQPIHVPCDKLSDSDWFWLEFVPIVAGQFSITSNQKFVTWVFDEDSSSYYHFDKFESVNLVKLMHIGSHEKNHLRMYFVKIHWRSRIFKIQVYSWKAFILVWNCQSPLVNFSRRDPKLTHIECI